MWPCEVGGGEGRGGRSKPEAAESAEVSPWKPCQGPRLFFLRAMESL